MDLGFLLHALIPSWTSVSTSSLNQSVTNSLNPISDPSIIYTFGASGCYLSRILYVLGHCWTYTTWKTCSRCDLTRRFPSPLSLQWSVPIYMCVCAFSSVYHILFCLIYKFVVQVCYHFFCWLRFWGLLLRWITYHPLYVFKSFSICFFLDAFQLCFSK